MALAVATVLAATPASGQSAAVSSPERAPSTATTAQPHNTGSTELPVSLDRIRDGLNRSEPAILQGLDRQVDFRIEIQERQKLDEMLKRLDFSSGPVPAGGLYMYEQQRRLFSPTERPLQQPYAAFSGGELITIAIQNLMGHYLGKPLIASVKGANRERQEQNSKDDVAQSIAEYCASRPDRSHIQLCTDTLRDR